MKYVKLFLAVVLAMLFTTACAKNDPSNNYTYPTLDPERVAILKSVYERIDNETPKEELITKEYSLSELKTFVRQGSPEISALLPIETIEQKFPVECIRKVSDKFYYVVYKVKEGGYLYVHLIYERDGEWKGEDNALHESHAYYAADEQPNIKEIKKGDPFSVVAAYDKSIASADVNFFSIPNDNGEGSNCVTIHRQDNKLYMITYEDGSSRDAIKQSTGKSVERIYNMKISPERYKEYDYEYNFKILNVDK